MTGSRSDGRLMEFMCVGIPESDRWIEAAVDDLAHQLDLETSVVQHMVMSRSDEFVSPLVVRGPAGRGTARMAGWWPAQEKVDELPGLCPIVRRHHRRWHIAKRARNLQILKIRQPYWTACRLSRVHLRAVKDPLPTVLFGLWYSPDRVPEPGKHFFRRIHAE